MYPIDKKKVSFNCLIKANTFISRTQILSFSIFRAQSYSKDVHFYHRLLEGTIVATFRLVLFPSASFKSSRSSCLSLLRNNGTPFLAITDIFSVKQ